ncbi:MAG: hypothetical protein ED559_08920 [Phycisphaera sp.]|nr:MAG: hypothetical protein ED559_08920 [Phycisphaera sp.]
MSQEIRNSHVRVALLGCGRVAQRVHAPLIARIPGASLAAVADPSADAKTIASRLNPDVRLFDSVEALIDASGFDAACICLPTHLHAKYAVRLLEEGIPIYLEKPIATNGAETSLILEAWGEKRVPAMVGFNYRFHPVHRKVHELLREGAVGRVTAIRTLFSTPPRALPEWKRNRTSGGGALLDLLSHHADLVMHHTGERVSSVSATRRSVYSEDDNAQVTYTLESGVLVHSTVSMTGAESDRFEIVGEDGVILADRFRGTVSRIPRSQSATMPEMAARSCALAMGQLRAFRTRLDPSFEPALRTFVESVRSGKPERPDLDDGWRSLAVVLGAVESASKDSQSVLVNRIPENATSAGEDSSSEVASAESNVGLSGKEESPALTVVLVTVTGMRGIGRVLSFLRKQTIASRLQVIAVAQHEGEIKPEEESRFSAFASHKVICVGEIDDVDRSAAVALEHAQATFMTFLEDHAFPEPEWAERIVAAAKSGPWDAVGTRIENGNPGTVLSWANMLMSYGRWVAAEYPGTTLHVARHNTTFRRATLEREYGSELTAMMGRDGGLLDDLLARGARFYQTHETCVEHLNPSTWRSTLQLRVGSGRLFASSRMKKERWSTPKRAMYIVLGFAIPFIRFGLLREELLTSKTRRERIGWRAYPALTVGVVLDGIGQFLGHTIGPGKVREELAHFEISRARHLRGKERHLMAPDNT